ncbi:hypothetical protein KKA15_02400 [Patescibacteria group bacterium]|nr:hypothetical protein [Patescibacteria group bacterium]
MPNIEFNYKNISFIKEDKIKNSAESLKTYVDHLKIVAEANNYESDEASIFAPFDLAAQKEIKSAVEQTSSNILKYIIVVGIGGSNLGTKAVYEALFGNLDSLKKRQPKIIFIDTVAPSLMANVKLILDEIKTTEEVLINLITKSGTNTEPIVNFEGLYAYLIKRFPNINERIVVTTSGGTKLWQKSHELGLTILDHPTVGGRYSVFTAVGLFPLAVVGVNINSLLKGAQEMRDLCISSDFDENVALISAVLIHQHYQKGKNILNNFFFNPELESVGKWYRQLIGESIGKEKDTRGNEVNAGITPIVSIGSTDLHSMAQLYLGGPDDKFTNFVYATDKSEAAVPTQQLFPGVVEGLEGKDLKIIMNAIIEGVKKAYYKKQIPYMEINMPEISAYTIGQFLQFKMMEMMYLAKLMGVNAFDQPNVEEYKEETRKLLES